ncbi:MAG: hypothetical protein BWX88_03595 [Planctomycetes bacterium ADurb.Bin126]|nr:MAG: hypothetical protein BWX88_03595 [Planctomycetes bacterium ADurb.Bin126]
MDNRARSSRVVLRRASSLLLSALAMGLFGTGVEAAGAPAPKAAKAAEQKAPVAASTQPAGLQIAFPDPRLGVHGLAWFAEDAPVLRRLPARLKETFRPPVWSLAQCPSGGRVRFRTDSLRIAVAARNPDTGTMHHMTTVGQSGLDLYVGADFICSAWPDRTGKIARTWTAGSDKAMRDITIYLPLYKPLSLESITLDAGAKVEPPRPYRVAKPIVYYGSSITQGGCAANPGLSAQAILGRRLDADFVNLGFSGNGLGEPELAKAICQIDASCIVLDFWGNPNAALYRQRLPAFVDILRAKFPTLPILAVSPFYFPAEGVSPPMAAMMADKRAATRELVAARRKAGDANIHFVDGLEMLNKDQACGLVDGIHPNSLGFFFNANGLEPHLRKVLKLQ